MRFFSLFLLLDQTRKGVLDEIAVEYVEHYKWLG